ncbi:hypothetical protein HYFRA_00008661 [Hymenoscyphus fraxineus]|uniref:Uncharacterized protein n=1 Tax=Hymenoscyphus fraxineus TaxID=746836 RepID=A0A9N9L0T3_9HELO|nr:hypothetical protein HYFRA_00008661 [Hymenoscyphus fraxineus]
MATSNGPDPRFGGRVLTYDPEAIKTALSTYYKALSKLPYVDESDIVYPPEGGWPNITASNFAPLGKTERVIELLKHLPYLRNNGKETGYAISFATFTIEYSAAPFTEPTDVEEADYWRPDLCWEEEPVKGWVVPLTMSEDNISGNWWLLDISDGTLTNWAHNDCMESDVDYEPEDPRAWRNTCGETRLLVELLNEWQGKFESLDWIAFSDPTGREKVWWRDDQGHDAVEYGQLEKIIKDHGWPHNFRRQECKEALQAWDEEHQDDLYRP